jgi:hypothetical protein
MKNRWCRLYSEILDDHKISQLDHVTFHFFINLLCIATEEANSGIISMDEKQLAWRMRFARKSVRNALQTLCKLDVIENGGTSIRLVNWCKRQFVSDDITARVKTWRDKNQPHLAAKETLHETLVETTPDTDTDTDTELSTKVLSASGDAEHPEFWLSKKKKKLSGKRLEAFKRFWKAFNYPKDRSSAIDAWMNIPELTNSLVDKIVSAAYLTASERPYLIENKMTPKMAQGWITARRWEDEVVGVTKTSKKHKTKEEFWKEYETDE